MSEKRRDVVSEAVRNKKRKARLQVSKKRLEHSSIGQNKPGKDILLRDNDVLTRKPRVKDETILIV